MSKKFKEMGPEDLVRQPADDGELFVAGTSYEVGAFVVYNGRLYVCKQATDGTKVPTDTDYWNDMTNVSARFTSVDTSTDPQPSGALSNEVLDKGIVKVVKTLCANLDPDNSSIADIIKALKGID